MIQLTALRPINGSVNGRAINFSPVECQDRLASIFSAANIVHACIDWRSRIEVRLLWLSDETHASIPYGDESANCRPVIPKKVF